MAKYSAEEISKRINDLEIDDDVKIGLMEDITDSISNDESEELSSLKNELDSVKETYEDLKNKYRERFLTAIEVKEEKKDEEKELEEKEVIDIKDI